MALHNEIAFETEICQYLVSHGWYYSATDAGYDRERALFPEDIFAWLEDAAPDELAKVLKPDLNPTMLAKARLRVLDRLVKVLGTDPVKGGGTLNALKKPVGVTPASLRMFQTKPADNLNPVTVERYGKNRLRVMRQVRYSQNSAKSLDLVFFLNGIPVATAELKTDLTQDAQSALTQYKQDRNPKGEPLLSFGRGALVHFVVSNQEVYMTTKLEGPATRFLPFNAGKNNGAGNAAREGTSPTAYFWEDLLHPDAWLTVLGKFIHYRFEEHTDPITGKKSLQTSTRFPRFHQWRAVNALAEAALEEGPGHNYLIQHSAGSGKTDSIAWTAYRLAALHREDGSKVFDGVIVISDRTVLDGQLQKAIEQLETVAGVFAPVTHGTESSKSKQLADALLKGKQIIGVTLQTFPYAMEEIRQNRGLADRKYAIIADEAHSSQSGEASKALKSVLTVVPVDEEDEGYSAEDVLAAEMAARAGAAKNLSFFAFTATPKTKTIELFGRYDDNGKPQVFDLYSMKQAIEEGFILDVLQNYTTYEMAARIAHANEESADVEVDQRQGSKALMRWVRLHPYNIAQKVAIIVEHFRTNVAHHLAGRAKAMVVTSSRKEAVRYKLAIDEYLRDKGYDHEVAALVAFSSEVRDPPSGPEPFTEHNMNPGLKGRGLAQAFATDEYQIMLVANKFQTGFDQPLLVAMYVDKKLSGITAVQTLSRLNRVIPGKEQTFVLDFVNDSNTILSAFQDYYEDASIQEASDPDIIHDMIMKLDAIGIYNDRDVDLVAEKWVAQRNHNGLYSHLEPAVDVFNDRHQQATLTNNTVELEQLEDFRKTAASFNKAYDFFSQIIDYGDTRIEKLAIYLKLLSKALKTKPTGNRVDLSDVVLTHYALKRQETHDLKLTPGQGQGLKGLTAVGSGGFYEKKVGTFGELIEQINKIFEGTGISDQDQINAVESVMRHAENDEQIQREAIANGAIDFRTSPTLPEKIDEIIYTAGEGHQQAINALLEMEGPEKLVEILLTAGLQDRARIQAERDTLINE